MGNAGDGVVDAAAVAGQADVLIVPNIVMDGLQFIRNGAPVATVVFLRAANVGGHSVFKPAELAMARQLVSAMTGEFEPGKFEDRYENAMIELIRSKQAGLPASFCCFCSGSRSSSGGETLRSTANRASCGSP